MNRVEIILLKNFLLKENLLTYDPYDIWKQGLGLKVKALFNKNRILAILPAAALTIFDFFINNRSRFFYTKQEYPVTRSLAANALLNIYKSNNERVYLDAARKHIEWLIKNYSKGYAGYCWGANMKWASKNGLYNEQMPFITHTPYALEALVSFQNVTGSREFTSIISSVYDFLDEDLHKMIDTEEMLALSYAPVIEPRPVVNANAYAIFCLSLLLQYKPEKKVEIKRDILRIYNFLLQHQQSDGSWWYYGDNKKQENFIDCFHSCFILKNLIKAAEYIEFPESFNDLIQKGYKYIISNFWNEETGLYKRFTKNDKVSLVKFDLYDNAEMLNLFLLMDDKDKFKELNENIIRHFVKGKDVYSAIDTFGQKKNKNTLRWAVMPYLYSLSKVYS